MYIWLLMPEHDKGEVGKQASEGTAAIVYR